MAAPGGLLQIAESLGISADDEILAEAVSVPLAGEFVCPATRASTGPPPSLTVCVMSATWSAHQDRHGKHFYYNSVLELSSWEHPQRDVFLRRYIALRIRREYDDASRIPVLEALEVCVCSRVRSHCRFVLPLIHFIPFSLRESVPLFLKRQCDRTLVCSCQHRNTPPH